MRFIYLSDTDLGYKLVKESWKPSSGEPSKSRTMELLVLEKESYSQALAKASQAVGIPTKTAALLVLDYRKSADGGKNKE